MGRPVVHWELWSDNPEKIAEFYQQVFDWDVREIPELTTGWLKREVPAASTTES